MKKFFALLCTMALVMSLFSGIALAAATDVNVTAFGFKAGASTQAGALSTLSFTATDASGDAVKYVEVDLGNTGFLPVGAGASVLGAGTVNGTKIIFSSATGAATGSYEIPVLNPAGLVNVTNGVTIMVSDAADGAGKVAAAAVNNYDLQTSYTVTAAPATALAGQTTNLTVTAAVNGAVTSNALTYTVVNTNGAVTVATGSAANGSFTIPMTFDIGNLDANSYTVTVTDGTYSGTGTVNVKFDLQMNTIGEVVRGDIKTFSGKLLNGKGEAIVGKAISLKNSASTTVASAVTASDGSFVFAYQFATADLYKVVVGNADYVEVAVKAQDGLTITPAANGPKTTLDTAANLDVTVKNGDNLVADATVTAKDPSGNAIAAAVHQGAGVYRFAAQAWNAGTYTITAKQGGTTVGSTTYYNYTSTATYTVASPAKLNASVAVQDLDLLNDGIHPNTGDANVTVTLVNAAGVGFKTAPANDQIKKVVYTVAGPIAEPKTYDSTVTAPNNNDTQFVVPVKVEQAGSIVVSGTVTYGDGSTENFEKTVTISGYVVNVEKTLGQVGDTVTLTAVVTDVAGNPVNNAKVSWKSVTGNRFFTKNADDTFAATTTADMVVDAQSTNINNGTYTTTAKLASAGALTIEVVRADQAAPIRATFAGKVNGSAAYTVTTDKASVVAGLSQTITVTTTDAAGKAVTALSNLKLESVALAAPLQLAAATAVDTDNDGIVDAYKFTVKPTKAGTITVTAETEGGNKVGTTAVAATAPAITAPAVVTDSVKEEITVSHNDGVNAQLKVTVVGGTADIFVGDAPAVATTYTFATAAASHSFKAVAKEVTEATPVAAELKLEVSYDNGASFIEAGRIAVKPVVIETDKDEVYLGIATPVTTAVKDAHGVGLADITITATGASAATGTSDANGETVLTVNPSSTGNITLSVTLNGTTFTKTVKAAADSVAPVVTVDTISAVVKTNVITVSGLVTDNTKVSRLYVNNAEVLVIPGAEAAFDAEVSLKLGKNVIRVFAFDAAGNASKFEQEVTYVLPTVVKLGVNSTEATIAGAPATLDAAPYIKAGRTMVPLRFIGEAFGATFDWKSETQTVTYYLDGTEITLTIGSTVAMVNGEAKNLDAAPEIVNGRTMVPVRFVSEALGAYVHWDAATNTVTVTR